MRWSQLLEYGKYMFLLALVIYTAYLWNTGLSICYRRVLLFLCGLLFLFLQDAKGLLNVVVVLLVTLMLWSINSQNSLDLQRNPYCYDYQSNLFLLIGYIVFNFSLAVFSVISLGFTVFLSITLCYDFWSSMRGQQYAAFHNTDVLNVAENKYLKENFQVTFNSRTMETNSCSICLANFDETEQIIMLPECKHIYHEGCLDQWLKINSVCPYCRFNVRDMIRQRMDSNFT